MEKYIPFPLAGANPNPCGQLKLLHQQCVCHLLDIEDLCPLFIAFAFSFGEFLFDIDKNICTHGQGAAGKVSLILLSCPCDVHRSHMCFQTNKKEQDLSEPFIVQTDPALVIPSDLLPSACGKNLQAVGLLRFKAELQMLSFCYQIGP